MYGAVLVVTLPNAGTYFINGQETIVSGDPSAGIYVECSLSTYPGDVAPQGAPDSSGVVSPSGIITLPLNGYFVAQTAPMTVYVSCYYTASNPNVQPTQPIYSQAGNLTAVQVK
jgi:hypothetical protein